MGQRVEWLKLCLLAAKGLMGEGGEGVMYWVQVNPAAATAVA